MGLNSSSAKVLCGLKFIGADFSRVAMLGRQNLVADIRVLREVYRLHRTQSPPPSIYAEPFFKALGAETVDSFDASAFEGATHVRDMNMPLDVEQPYSLVFDGGTLEHVFDVHQALANAMQMVAVGGYFVQEVPANNQMGHGFWQFSPEYAYRTFAPEHGFETLAVLVQEDGRDFYRAHDPAHLGYRVQVQNRRPTSLTVVARKIADRHFGHPQQSDYQAAWQGGGTTPKARLIDVVRRFIPDGLERSLRPAFRNRSHARLADAHVMRGDFSP